MQSSLDSSRIPLLVLCWFVLVVYFPTSVVRAYDKIDTGSELRTAITSWHTDPLITEVIYGPIAMWNTSSVTDMSYIFYNISNFDSDVSAWDTSRVTNMDGMFS